MDQPARRALKAGDTLSGAGTEACCGALRHLFQRGGVLRRGQLDLAPEGGRRRGDGGSEEADHVCALEIGSTWTANTWTTAKHGATATHTAQLGSNFFRVWYGLIGFRAG